MILKYLFGNVMEAGVSNVEHRTIWNMTTLFHFLAEEQTVSTMFSYCVADAIFLRVQNSYKIKVKEADTGYGALTGRKDFGQ